MYANNIQNAHKNSINKIYRLIKDQFLKVLIAIGKKKPHTTPGGNVI